MAKLQKEVDRLEGNDTLSLLHMYFYVFLYRRITRRKGEIQGCKRRTRHDIKRIVGLLKTSIQYIIIHCGNVNNNTNKHLSSIKNLFFFSFCLLNPITFV
jgi:uncharacterized protein YeeX (DUF496 family)